MAMGAPRRSFGILRKDRIRIEVIKRKMKINLIFEKEIQKRQLVRYGHVKRMGENRISKITIQYKPIF